MGKTSKDVLSNKSIESWILSHVVIAIPKSQQTAVYTLKSI